MTSQTAPAVPLPPTRPARWTPSPTWTARILWANLVGQVVIVVTGGIVRLTGSGLGCSSWPQCEPGEFTPVLHQAVSWHPYVEFGNRTLTAILGVIAFVTAWVVWRQRERSRGYRLLGVAPFAGVVVQGVVGGLTVLVDLDPRFVAMHFLISMLLVAASTALVLRFREGDGPAVPVVPARALTLGRVVALLTVPVLVLGVVVTGAGPHSGDEEAAYRFALDPAFISRFHSASVWLYLAGVVALVVMLRRRSAPPAPRDAAQVLLVVTLLQGLVGYVQYFTGLPAVLVATHMLGASLLVVAQVNQLFSMRERPRAAADRSAGLLDGAA